MIRFALICWWVDTGGLQEPSFQYTLPAPWKAHNISGQLEAPVAPNATVWEVICTEAAYQAILDDPNYGPGAILWSEEV